jgi:hypothetical protein
MNDAVPGLDAQALMDNVVSVAQTSGLFDRVNAFEPKQAPGNGLTAAVWVQSIKPYQQLSGLAAVSARVEFTLRIYTNMLAEPMDAIDPNVLSAAATLMNLFAGDFDLDDSIFAVDLLGMNTAPLSAKAGYVNQDGKLFRMMDLTIPLLVADVWEQSA